MSSSGFAFFKFHSDTNRAVSPPPLRIAASEGPTDNGPRRDVPFRPPAPISILPYELLSAIFLAGHSDPTNLPSCSVELVIASVNQLWRSIALSISNLWRRIHIDDVRRKTRMAMIQTYATRSGRLPFDVHINIGPDPDSETSYQSVGKSIHRVLSYLSPRLGCLKIESTWWSCLLDLLRRPQNPAPLLKSLEIVQDYHFIGWDGYRPRARNRPHDIFCKTPQLQSVRLHGMSLSLCKPPLTSVTRLEIHNTEFEDIGSSVQLLRTLHRLPELTHLILCGPWIDDDPVIIELPSLQLLHVRPGNNYQALPLIRMISAPSLHTLSLEHPGFGYAEPGMPPVRYPNLRTLILLDEGQRYRTVEYWNILGDTFPTITHLIQRHGPYKSFLAYLKSQVGSSATPIWPRLQSVTLFGKTEVLAPIRQSPGSVLFGPDDILLAVAARSNSGNPINKLCLPRSSMSLLGVARLLDPLQKLVEVEANDFDYTLPGVQFLIGPFNSSLVD